MQHRFWVVLATCYKIGYAKKAPGTFGSLLGIPVGWGVQILSHSALLPQSLLSVGLLLVLGGFCLKAVAEAEAHFGEHDNQKIVIDEVLGQAIVTAFLPVTFFHAVAAFAAFRFFDIAKPGPVGWADRRWPGALGTLGDDVIAGVLALLTIFLLRLLLSNQNFF